MAGDDSSSMQKVPSRSESRSNQPTAIRRKRSRSCVVLSDDEDEMCAEDVATSDELISRSNSNIVSPACSTQMSAVVASSNSYTHSPSFVNNKSNGFWFSTTNEHDQCFLIKIDGEPIHVEAACFVATRKKPNIESLKVELACLHHLQLPTEKKSEGAFPIFRQIKCGDTVIESLETLQNLKDLEGNILIEASTDGWVKKQLMKLYVEACKEVSQELNVKLLKKLYDSEVSDDEVIVSCCDLHDYSVIPLLNALQVHKPFVKLDLSHNCLGKATLKLLQQVFVSLGQNYGGLTLDLHCNGLGPTSLCQIIECPVLCSQLKVLNLSGNRLTDACKSYLSAVLKECRALHSLNVERCSITFRTVQAIADALDAGSMLEQLFIGHNKNISEEAFINLLAKLTTLKRFSALSLNGLCPWLLEHVIDSLCQFTRTSCLSSLLLGETDIGNESALLVTESLLDGPQESVKLDLSYCCLTSDYFLQFNVDLSLFCSILELNLAGNQIACEGTNALSSLILNRKCCLRVLVLEKCQLGPTGTLQILQALACYNNSLEDLNLADNVDLHQHQTEPHDTARVTENNELDQLEFADNDDDEDAVSEIDDSCASSSSREKHFTREISTAISKAKKLKLLDLSSNGLSTEAAEMVYTAWSSSRPCPPSMHIKDQTVHLVTEGRKCCVEPCCKLKA